jgi:hypothetical protein
VLSACDEPSRVPDQTKAFTHMATSEQQRILSWPFVSLKISGVFYNTILLNMFVLSPSYVLMLHRLQIFDALP